MVNPMTPRRVAVIRHMAFEDMGIFGEVLAQRGCSVSTLDAGIDNLADAIREADLAVILGGPIGVYETERYPFLKEELLALENRLAAGRPTLGICLGAQLIAAALGARVYPGGKKEIGWSGIRLTGAGERSCLAALASQPVLHWHGDTFDLPQSAQLLASSAVYENQAFSLGNNVLALQFHAEADISLREVAAVYRSGALVWLVTYLYWTAFGTLTFFAATMPTYLVDQWQVDTTQASMVYTALLVVCVAITRPLGGWLADRFDTLRILAWMFGLASALALVLVLQISLQIQLFAIYALALLSGASAASVIKLIPTYFKHVGAVSGLAKAAGAACGFTMTVTLAASKHLLGGYTVGFVIWALMNVAAFYIVFSRVGFRKASPVH